MDLIQASELVSNLSFPILAHSFSSEISRAKKTTTKNSASLESLIPTEAADFARIHPLLSRKTPHIPICLDFPLADLSTFHFHVLRGGHYQCETSWVLIIFFFEYTLSRFGTSSLRLFGNSSSNQLFIQKLSLSLIWYNIWSQSTNLHSQTPFCF